MYRASWLLVALPLLIALLSATRPAPLSAPGLPPTFDSHGALAFADQLASLYPSRLAGSPGALGAAQWFETEAGLSGYSARCPTPTFARQPFTATIPGRGRVRLTNLVATAPNDAEAGNRFARGPVILVLAHRDNAGTGPGANDNASGTGALLELARAYGVAPGRKACDPAVRPTNTLVFLSTDGGVQAGVGARHFIEHSQYRKRIAAAINLDAIAGKGPARVEIAGDAPHSPSKELLVTAAARILDQTGSEPGRTSAIGQLIDLGFPFSLYEQAPFLGHKVGALTLTTSGDRPRQPYTDTVRVVQRGRSVLLLNQARVSQIGRATQSLLGSLDLELAQAQGTSSYVYLGSRFVRGWAIELVLITILVPFLVAAVDLFARCRRRGIPLRPALRAYRARLLFWLLIGALFELFAVTGVWPKGSGGPVDPASSAASHWPVFGLLGLAALVAITWAAARSPLVARRQTTPEEDLAGHVAALLALAVVSLLVVATNPFALLFLLPSVHAWLWLAQVRGSVLPVRLVVLLTGFLGPLLLLGSFAFRFGLGFDAPWYLAELVAVGYVGLLELALVLAWAAAAAQLVVLTFGRYAPYPTRGERPRGPLREVVRLSVLTLLRVRARRRVTRQDEHALEA